MPYTESETHHLTSASDPNICMLSEATLLHFAYICLQGLLPGLPPVQKLTLRMCNSLVREGVFSDMSEKSVCMGG